MIYAFRPLISQGAPIDGSQMLEIPKFPEQTILSLCDEAINKLSEPVPLVYLPMASVVVGDIHGNIRDLIRILHLFGTPRKVRYCFLGDYVDRGDHSVAVIALLFAYFVRYPANVTMIRGNHEFKHVNETYGFLEDVRDEYGSDRVWRAANDVFARLPFAAVLGNSAFCVHGGLGPSLKDIRQVELLKLPVVSYNGSDIMADLVWSDPESDIKGYRESDRGSGVTFGPDVVREFLKKNRLKLIIRAHQVVQNGVHAFAGHMGVTVFSCSNYCDDEENKCGVISVKDNGELHFYSLGAPGAESIKPKAVMQIAPDGEQGLRKRCRKQQAKVL